jgi:Fic family protein
VSLWKSLCESEERKTELEARNARLQFQEIVRITEKSGGDLKFNADILKRLHYVAMRDICSFAGKYREWPVKIIGSPHRPPDAKYVLGLVDEMCDHFNQRGEDPLYGAAYLMWRIAWIHPFGDGNGRTGRAASYLAFCVHHGAMLPGEPVVMALKDKYRPSYTGALRDADEAFRQSVVDVNPMKSLLDTLFAEQVAGHVRLTHDRT